jgi:hypothetical protein
LGKLSTNRGKSTCTTSCNNNNVSEALFCLREAPAAPKRVARVASDVRSRGLTDAERLHVLVHITGYKDRDGGTRKHTITYRLKPADFLCRHLFSTSSLTTQRGSQCTHKDRGRRRSGEKGQKRTKSCPKHAMQRNMENQRGTGWGIFSFICPLSPNFYAPFVSSVCLLMMIDRTQKSRNIMEEREQRDEGRNERESCMVLFTWARKRDQRVGRK